MREKGLDGIINDLDKLGNNFDKIIDKKTDNIISKLMALIGKSTAYDTGVARDLISQILIDLGREDLISELEYKMYEFWKTRRKRELEGSTYSFEKLLNSHNKKYKISIIDDGFYQQQQGKVSEKHPRNDANVIPYNVDFYIDKMETKNDNELEKLFIELENYIADLVEGKVTL